MMFALTIVTTIGYGSFTVHTVAGKVFTVIYALFGILIYGWCNIQFVRALKLMLQAEEGSCRRMCRVRCSFRLHEYSQCGHRKGLSSVCVNMCVLTCDRCDAVYSQPGWLQRKGRSLECVLS